MQDHGQRKSTAAAADHRDPASANAALLGADDPDAVTLLRGAPTSPFLLVIDHAGWRVPAALGDLGLPLTDRRRHIAWDIGVAGTGQRLAGTLQADMVAQAYSRLVIDCNRTPGHATSIAPWSDATEVPGNLDLADAARAARVREIFLPYHAAIAGLLDARLAAGRDTVLVALHSFTPRLLGAAGVDRPSGGTASGARPWHVGVLHNHDPRFALILRDLLQAEGDLVVGDNEPYMLSDLDDYTVPVHGERRGLPHVEIEIRQDLIADEAGQADWAARLARLLPQAWTRYRVDHGCP